MVAGGAQACSKLAPERDARGRQRVGAGRFNERLIELHEKVASWRPSPINAKP